MFNAIFPNPLSNPVNRSRNRTAPPAGLLLGAALLLAGCAGSNVGAPAPDSQPSAPPVVEPTAEPDPVRARSTFPSNVREGPGTDHPVDFWIEAATEVTVVGRNADGTWLRIEYEGRSGWISAGLTDLAAEVLVDLPELEAAVAETAAPTPAPVAVLIPTVTPAPPAAPEPDPEPATVPEPEPMSLTVTGNPVNVREGPGTGYPIALRAAAGDQFEVTGRNADGTWLQVADPRTAESRLWIYGPLTDLDPATALAMLVVASESQPVAQASAPEPQPVGAAPTVPVGCTRLHTVNPNETQLVQITNWFGLDLAATAALNAIDPEAPLIAGTKLCLPDAVASQVQPAASALQPRSAAGGQCLSAWGNPHPCPEIPNHPERAVKSVPGVPILYHAPGSYSRDLPGLDYDFELVLGDDSSMWNWRMRDSAACYDALRVHMGEVPESIGLMRLEVRLSDPVELEGEALEDMEFTSSTGFPDVEWTPELEATGDIAYAELRCYDRPQRRPDDDVFCRVFPLGGHSGSIHLEAAVIRSVADAAGQMSRRAKAYQYAWNHPVVLHADSFLYPVIDDGSGDPAGSGPCMEVTRSG